MYSGQDTARPIRLLMRLALIFCAVYVLLFLLLFFNQQAAHSLLLLQTARDSYYNWFNLLATVIEFLGILVLYKMVKRQLADNRRSFTAVAVPAVVFLLIIPLFWNLTETFQNRFLMQGLPDSALSSRAAWEMMVDLIAPVVFIAHMAALVGCVSTWHRGVVMKEEIVNQIECSGQKPD